MARKERTVAVQIATNPVGPPTALAALEENVSFLEESLSTLMQRLEPVMIGNPDVPATCITVDGSALRNKLAELNERVGRTHHALVAIASTLDTSILP